jgi:TRAP-type C4-dicarboxylate transport system permease small subunit
MQPVLTRLQRAQLALAAIALAVMTLITVIDVFMRYAFNRPVRGSYDIVECALVVFVFHGTAVVFLQRKNIVIDLIDSLAGKAIRDALIRLSDIVSIGCLLLLGWAMLSPAWQAYLYGDRKIELGLPLFVLWILAGSGMIGTILCAIGALFAGPAIRSRERPL